MRYASNTRGRDEPSTASADEAWYVLGGGHVGEQIARYLGEAGHTASFVDDTHESSVVPSHSVDPTDVRALTETGIGPGSTVVVTTDDDGRNLLVAQLVRVHLEPDRIVVLANSPETVRLLEDAGHESICATTALSVSVTEAL
ncbi:NAD-binding protein [Haloarchaeobius litoreus]|uniref:NAD-binding protein n=1 Tax=Haloarchaeobius litoreus TaxID=755306 RepID=A0ABD6DP16_9EURY|nr:NAD-binding protein [Haloarchaeobius litoreus]